MTAGADVLHMEEHQMRYKIRQPAVLATAISPLANRQTQGGAHASLSGDGQTQLQTRTKLNEREKLGSLDVRLVLLAFTPGQFTFVGLSGQPFHTRLHLRIQPQLR